MPTTTLENHEDAILDIRPTEGSLIAGEKQFSPEAIVKRVDEKIDAVEAGIRTHIGVSDPGEVAGLRDIALGEIAEAEIDRGDSARISDAVETAVIDVVEETVGARMASEYSPLSMIEATPGGHDALTAAAEELSRQEVWVAEHEAAPIAMAAIDLFADGHGISGHVELVAHSALDDQSGAVETYSPEVEPPTDRQESTQLRAVLRHGDPVEIAEYVGHAAPELLVSEIGVAAAEEVRIQREVASPYRYNNPVVFMRDELILRELAKGGQEGEYCRQFITDRPDDERAAMEWVSQQRGAYESEAGEVVALAQRYESEARTLYESRSVMGQIAAQIGYDADTLKGYLWEKAPDRRAALHLVAKVAELQDISPELKHSVSDMIIQPGSVRMDYAAQFLDHVEAGLADALGVAGQTGGRTFVSEYIDLLRVSNARGIENFIANLGAAGFRDLLRHIEEEKREEPDSDLSRVGEVLIDYVSADLTMKGTVEDRVAAVNQMESQGIYGVCRQGPLRLYEKDILVSILENPDRQHGFESFNKLLDNPFVQQILDDEVMGPRIAKSMGSVYTNWAEIGSEISSDPPDKMLREYILAHLRQAAAIEEPSLSMKALTGFELPQEVSISAIRQKAVDLVGAVLAKEGLDKLPTNEAKLRVLVPDEDIRVAYFAVLDAKSRAGESGETVQIEALLRELVEAGAINDDLAAAISEASPVMQASEIIADLRKTAADRTEWQKARNRWLGEYANQPIRTAQLVNAWRYRADALQAGVGDAPGEIIEWAKYNAFKQYTDQLRQDNYGGELPTEADMVKHRELIAELTARYPVSSVLNAVNRFIRGEKEGLHARRDLAPGRVEVEVEGEAYKVEVLDKSDPRGFSIGYDTGCCMTVDGASESCIWAGYEDPRYGFMAVYKNGRLRGQSLLYIGDSATDAGAKDVLVVDNIEANRGTDMLNLVEVYKRGLSALRHGGALRSSVRQVNLGTANSDVDFSNLPQVASVPPPRSDVYTDARQQRLMLSVS